LFGFLHFFARGSFALSDRGSWSLGLWDPYKRPVLETLFLRDETPSHPRQVYDPHQKDRFDDHAVVDG